MKFIFNAYGGDKCELDLIENKKYNLYLSSGSSQKTVKNINHQNDVPALSAISTNPPK